MTPPAVHIEVRDLTMAYGSVVIQRHLTFTIRRGDIFIIMGGSGCGKSTLLRHLIGLQAPARGAVLIEGEDLWTAAPEDQERMKRRFGVLFQNGGLWSSMTLAENVALPLEVYTELSPSQIRQVVALKLALVGLAGCEAYYPSEISGGSDRRGAPLDGRRPAVSAQREWTDRAAGGWHQRHAQHGAAAMKDGQQLVRQLDGRIGRLTDSLGDTSKVAQTTLGHTQRTLDGDLNVALQEMTAAMRAIRLLADYLERNPNALLYGKGGDRR